MESMKMLKNQDFIKQINLNKMNIKNWLYPNTHGVKVDAVLLFLRLFFGGFILLHGFPKLEKLLSGSTEFADPFGIGAQASLFLTVFAEFVCAILLILGLFTRLAVIPLIVTMLTAVFIIHGNDPLSDKEHASLYLIVFFCIYLLGPGRFSIDDKLFRSKL